MAGMQVIRVHLRKLLVRRNLLRGVLWTCTVMFQNGVKIPSLQIILNTQAHRKLLLLNLKNNTFIGAVVGSQKVIQLGVQQGINLILLERVMVSA